MIKKWFLTLPKSLNIDLTLFFFLLKIKGHLRFLFKSTEHFFSSKKYNSFDANFFIYNENFTRIFILFIQMLKCRLSDYFAYFLFSVFSQFSLFCLFIFLNTTHKIILLCNFLTYLLYLNRS